MEYLERCTESSSVLDFLNDFVREGEMMRLVSHPNIVALLGIYVHEGSYSLVQEFVQV